MVIRSPIIVIVGHIDHGKTTLLDKIRGSSVVTLEPGKISQHVGASYIPVDTAKKICGELLKKFKVEITIPGFLLLDTPGHAAFITLRRRGGSVSDLAVLVVDVNEGFQEQTDESLTVLKEFKTPFVIAATKIDKIAGWNSTEQCFLDNLEKQSDYAKDEADKKVYRIVSQLAERGFESERFDRVEDFRKQIAIVPCSGLTGEGVSDLLVTLAGLAQQFLKERLEISEKMRGTVLEVKEVKGLGTTIDVILYDGNIRKGDYLVIGGKEPVVTKVKALLIPRPLKELRVEKQFDSVEDIHAAAGVKIVAPGLENVISGSPIIAVKGEEEIELAKQEVQQEIEEVQFSRDVDGVIVKADTLGSLEAMIKLLEEGGIPIRKADAGSVNREDVIESQNVSDRLRKAILVFNLKVSEDINNLAKDLGIRIFESDVIYRLIEEYKKWCIESKEREIEEKLEVVTRPAQIKFLKGYVFRASDPAVFGVEILKGVLKPGVLMRKERKIVGKVKEIQKEGKNISEAKAGDRVAVSMEEPTIGRQIREGDILTVAVNEDDRKLLKELWDKLSESEKELLEET